MDWLNYHHLLYFWVVAREGSVTRAGQTLRLAPPTVSGQIHALEASLGEKLFERQGRRLVLTEIGRTVYRYADEIFALGRELVDTVKDRPTGRPMRLVVGIADVVPKLIAWRIVEPAFRQNTSVRLVCREDRPERLLADLTLHVLDVVITDSPVTPGSGVRAFNHLLGECGVTFFARSDLAARYRRGFPRSLDGAPMLLPGDQTSARRALEQWFSSTGVRPQVIGEFDDSALLKTFGQKGIGVFPGSSVIAHEIAHQYGVVPIGRTEDVRERYYAVTIERRLKHPAVVSICETARQETFARPSPRGGRAR